MKIASLRLVPTKALTLGFLFVKILALLFQNDEQSADLGHNFFMSDQPGRGRRGKTKLKGK